jgi:peroxiredoxin
MKIPFHLNQFFCAALVLLWVQATAVSSEVSLPQVIDLHSFYQTKFGTNGGFENFPVRPTIDGLPFQPDGRVELFGKMNADRGDVKPTSISGIKIGAAFDELHLLHDASWEETPGRTVAIIRLHYTDGSSNNFEIKYGVHVMDWCRLPAEETEVLTDGGSKIVWRGPGIYKGTSRLFKTVLQNPYPGKTVETMDLISTGTRASYKLAAATVAKHDPQRAVTPGLSLNQPAWYFDGALKVSVLDKETGAPIADADVFPYTDVYDQGIIIAPQLTSSNGETVVKYPVDGTASLGFTVTKPGYLGRSGNWQRGNIPQTITYRLAQSQATIQGVVQDDNGKPLAGAQVRLNNYNFNSDLSDGGIYLPNESVQTDADGHWSISGLPDSYQDFGVTVSHPDFPQAQFYADGPNVSRFNGQHIPAADFFAGNAVLKLTSGCKITGIVRDPTRQPVSGAIVFAGFDRYMGGAVKTITDDHGNFSLKNLGLGENYLTISAPGLAPEFRTVTIAATNAALDVVLKPGKVIHGRVTDASGKPVEDAEVSYDGLADRNGIFNGRTIEWKTQTDANGEFTWNSAPEKAVNLSITKSGYMALEWMRVETDTTNATSFTLGSPLTIKGSVTDADTGEAIAGFKVTPGWPENGGARLQKQEAKAGVAGHYEVHFDRPIIISPTPYDFVFQISSPGYAPVQSRSIKSGEGVVTWDVKIKKTPVTISRVKTADGKPAAGVKVLLVADRNYLQLMGTQLRNQNNDSESFETDAEGHFELPPQDGDFALAAASDAGFALVQKTDFTNDLTLTLQSWGRIEGTFLKNGRSTSGQELYFFAGDASAQRNVWSQQPAATDVQGHFIFPYVPPGIIRVQLKQPMTGNGWSYQELQSVEVQPGGTNNLQINIKGRAVKGQLKRSADLATDVDLSQFSLMLQPDVPQPEVPEGLDPDKIQKWYQDWMKTEAGRKFVEAMSKRSQLQVKANGTFSADIVAPGKYKLNGSLFQSGSMQAQIEGQDVVVPENFTDDSDAPFDVGTITVKAVKHLNVGDLAPDFSTKTLDGQPLKLSDFKGKYVLLDFWATWCGPCVAETPNMKATYDAFGKDPRFVMLSLSLDPKVSAPQKFVQEKKIQWLQGFLGDWSKDTVTKDYAVFGIPSLFLIGPDGKIITQNLRGEAIKAAVERVLNTH